MIFEFPTEDSPTEFQSRVIANLLQRGWVERDDVLEKDLPTLDQGWAEIAKAEIESIRP